MSSDRHHRVAGRAGATVSLRATLLGLALLAPSLPAGAQVQVPAGCDPVPDSYIVVLAAQNDAEAEKTESTGRAADKDIPSTSDRASSLAASYGAPPPAHVYDRVLGGYAGSMTASQAHSLSYDSEVDYVQQDCWVRLASDPPVITQADPAWGLDRIDQRETPLDDIFEYAYTGQGVNVYVIDSGIRRTHTEFGNRVATGHSVFGGTTDDATGHGTHVAGTIAGATVGIARDATIHPVRVFGTSFETPESAVIAGVDWVTENAVLPAVANMSIGGPVSEAKETAVSASIDRGIVYVVSAGNSHKDACQQSPAHIGPAITVGAISNFEARAGFSNWGTCVDLFAPGTGTRSASSSGDTYYSFKSGTSMASPHVAGVVATILQKDPTASVSQVTSTLLAGATQGVLRNESAPDDPPPPAPECEEIEDPDGDNGGPLEKSTTNGPEYPCIPIGEFDSVLGPGSPNLLLHSAFLHQTPPDDPPVASFSVYCHELTCTFDASASTDDNGIVSYVWNFGDGTNVTRPYDTVVHTYASAGTYLVSLAVVDTADQSGFDSHDAHPTDPPTCSITSFGVNNNGPLPVVSWATTCGSSVSVRVKTTTLSSLPAGCSVTGALWDGAKNGSRTADYMVGGYGASSQCPPVEQARFWIELWEGSQMIGSRPAQNAYYTPPTSPCEITSFSVTPQGTGQTPLVSWGTSCNSSSGATARVLTTTISSTASGCSYDAHEWASGNSGSQNAGYMAGGYGSGCGSVGHAVFWLELRDDASGNLLRRTNYFDAYYTP